MNQSNFSLCSPLTFALLVKNIWLCFEVPGSLEPYSGSSFGAVHWNAGCNALQILDGGFQRGQDPLEGCTVISPTSTSRRIWEPVPRRSGAAGRTNKALTCFSARQLHVVQQETLCTMWPGHRHKQKGTERLSQQPVLMSLCVIFMSLKIKCS